LPAATAASISDFAMLVPNYVERALLTIKVYLNSH